MQKPLMGKDKDSLILQKQDHVQKQRETKDLFSASYQQVMSSHFLGTKTSAHVAVAPEDKFHK